MPNIGKFGNMIGNMRKYLYLGNAQYWQISEHDWEYWKISLFPYFLFSSIRHLHKRGNPWVVLIQDKLRNLIQNGLGLSMEDT